MDKASRVYVAGHRGLVGSALGQSLYLFELLGPDVVGAKDKHTQQMLGELNVAFYSTYG